MSQRICFVGAPGTGKSTVAQALVPRLKMMGLDAEFAPEYARAYLRRSGPPQTPFEQFVIFAGACDREDELDIHNYVVTDSASFLSEIYYAYERRKHHAAGDQVKLDRGYHEIARMSRERLKLFAHVFYVPQGLFAPGDDPTRAYVPDQHVLDRMMKGYLDTNLVDYVQLTAATLDDRLEEVIGSLTERGAFDGRQLRDV